MFGVGRCNALVVLSMYALVGTSPLVRKRMLFAESPHPSVRTYYVDSSSPKIKAHLLVPVLGNAIFSVLID